MPLISVKEIKKFLLKSIKGSNVWYDVETTGTAPPPRANHSSAVVKKYLYIFGGWDGSKRLNDLYKLDTGIRKRIRKFFIQV